MKFSNASDEIVGSLIQGDCLELMQTLPDKSIDMILCDLPYGTTACKWDTVIPFEPLWQQYKRIIRRKKGGGMCIHSQSTITTDLINSNRKWFKYCWVWEKEQGVNFLLAKKQPLKVHEDIVVFANGVPTYYPQMAQGKSYISGKGNSGEVTKLVNKIQTKNEGTRYPKSIMRFNRQTGIHPTQKPVALFEYLIKTYTQKGGLVLDPFMGSWTTAVACRNTDRDWIGAEQLEKYCEVGEKRIGEC